MWGNRYEATYGIMNEKSVAMGESTCSGVFATQAVGYGGKALLSIDELSRIALERCDTARCAVQMMGDLAVEYGFYGPDGGTEGGAESQLVSDPDEVFIFHILPDDTGTSAIWVAQRIPDDHVAVVPNMFVIRGVNLSDSYNFLGSKNMMEIATKHKLWPLPGRENDLLDFTAAFSDGEYGSKFYSGRRIWAAFHEFAPSVILPSNYTDLRYDAVYPVSLKPDKKIDAAFLMKLHGNYYQGTPFDMTVGLAAGPFGAPDRWPSSGSTATGNFERSIGIYRTAHTHIVQSRKSAMNGQGAILWYGPDKAATSIFFPISAKSSGIHPSLYVESNPFVLSRKSAYWACRYIFNIIQAQYKYMIVDVNALQQEHLNASMALIEKLDRNPDLSADALSEAYALNAESILTDLWLLPDRLIEKYADGYAVTYPNWWLNAVGYAQGPPPPPVEPTPAF